MALYSILFGMSLILIALVVAIIRKMFFHWKEDNKIESMIIAAVERPTVSVIIYTDRCVLKRRKFLDGFYLYDTISKSDINFNGELNLNQFSSEGEDTEEIKSSIDIKKPEELTLNQFPSDQEDAEDIKSGIDIKRPEPKELNLTQYPSDREDAEDIKSGIDIEKPEPEELNLTQYQSDREDAEEIKSIGNKKAAIKSPEIPPKEGEYFM